MDTDSHNEHTDDVKHIITNKLDTDDVVQHTDDVVQHTDDVVQHTDDVVQHTDDVVQPTDDVVQPTDDVVQHTVINKSYADGVDKIKSH